MEDEVVAVLAVCRSLHDIMPGEDDRARRPGLPRVDLGVVGIVLGGEEGRGAVLVGVRVDEDRTKVRVEISLAVEEKERGKPFDAIVVDVLMPIMDGFSAAMLLRENDCSKLIISITERGMFCDEAESSQAGCDFHMSKSELYRQLIPAMREYL